MTDHSQYEPIPVAIGLLMADGAILDERLRNLLNAYSDVEPEAAPPGYQHAAVEHGPFIPLLVQAGAVPTRLADMPNLQIEITATEGREDDFYERLERLLRECRAAAE